jgi:hypothetical protein
MLVLLMAGCGEVKAPPKAATPRPPVPDLRRFNLSFGNPTQLELTLPAVADSDPDNPKAAEGGPFQSLVRGQKTGEALNLHGPTLSGKPLDWDAYRGRVVLVIFWSSQDPESQASLEQMNDMLEFYRYRPFSVVGVNLDEDPSAATAILRNAKPNFEIILDGDQQFALARRYAFSPRVPYFVLVDKSGDLMSFDIRDQRMSDRLDKIVAENYAGAWPSKPIPPNGLRQSTGGASRTNGASNTGGARAFVKGQPKEPLTTTASPKKPATGKIAKSGDTTDDDTFVEAKTGVGKKGRGYGGGIYTEPIRTMFRAEQWIVFDVQIPSAMKIFKGLNDRDPKSHEEFMKEIIEANSIELPELPAGQEYVYLPEEAKLMVRQPE